MDEEPENEAEALTQELTPEERALMEEKRGRGLPEEAEEPESSREVRG